MLYSILEGLAARVRSPEEVEALVEISVATATMPLKIFKMLPESTATAGAVGIFSEDARAIR